MQQITLTNYGNYVRSQYGNYCIGEFKNYDAAVNKRHNSVLRTRIFLLGATTSRDICESNKGVLMQEI
jgi:hypothetical protein